MVSILYAQVRNDRDFSDHIVEWGLFKEDVCTLMLISLTLVTKGLITIDKRRKTGHSKRCDAKTRALKSV